MVTGAGGPGAVYLDSETNRDDLASKTGHAAMLASDSAYPGTAFVDMKSDRDGVPKVTEINAGRFGTAHDF